MLDIGASVGNTVAQVLDLCPGATVFAFEPRAEAVEELTTRFRENERVHITPCGVGAAPSRMSLHLLSWRSASSFLPMNTFGRELGRQVGIKEEGVVQAEVVTLDAWYDSLDSAPATIDLIKVDAQGFEKYVVAGGRRVFDKTRFVIMEAGFLASFEDTYFEQSLLVSVDPTTVISYGLTSYWKRS